MTGPSNVSTILSEVKGLVVRCRWSQRVLSSLIKQDKPKVNLKSAIQALLLVKSLGLEPETS